MVTYQGFFKKCSLGGKSAFVGRENVKNIQKTNKICYCLGGGGRGGISPLTTMKKKNTVTYTSITAQFNKYIFSFYVLMITTRPLFFCTVNSFQPIIIL